MPILTYKATSNAERYIFESQMKNYLKYRGLLGHHSYIFNWNFYEGVLICSMVFSEAPQVQSNITGAEFSWSLICEEV